MINDNSTNTTMSFALKVKQSIFVLINEYESNLGIGTDYYSHNLCYHPMAEGKYLTSLALLYNASVISKSFYDSRVTKAIKRLEDNNFSRDGLNASWGLGFEYKSTDATEPFIITTSIIARGLMDNLPHIDDSLLKMVVNWLQSYSTRSRQRIGWKSLSLPWFSPRTDIVVTNAVAYWINVMTNAKKLGYVVEGFDDSLFSDWILRRYVDGVGWPYTDNNPRVDLLHQFYIINSLLEIGLDSFAEEACFSIFNNFYSQNSFLDKIEVGEKDQLIQKYGQSGKVVYYPMENMWVAKFSTEARLWSYSELLVGLGELAVKGQRSSYWLAMAKKTANIILDKYPFYVLDWESEYKTRYRDTTHLLHGLVKVFIALRSREK